jgi:hypothetical protein
MSPWHQALIALAAFAGLCLLCSAVAFTFLFLRERALDRMAAGKRKADGETTERGSR